MQFDMFVGPGINGMCTITVVRGPGLRVVGGGIIQCSACFYMYVKILSIILKNYGFPGGGTDRNSRANRSNCARKHVDCDFWFPVHKYDFK